MRTRRASASRRLSESPLWAAQRGFYERSGVDAWQSGTVPHHVTSNVALATAYARVVLGFLGDDFAHSREPLDVLELGAGSGRFAFLFLRALDALRVRPTSIRYVMTDVAESTMRFWREHEALTPFLRDGRLDFARFDADRDHALRLERAGLTIAPDAPARRLVVIANYVFSGLRHDAFAVGGGQAREYLTAATLPHRGHSTEASLRWRAGGRVTAPYPDDDVNAVLRDDAATRRAGRLLVPIGALRCLDRLSVLAREDVLILAADRGTTGVADALALGADLDLARHGAVSFPVSFHALRAWVTRRGGRPLHPRRRHRHVHVAAFLLGASRGGWPATRSAYDAMMTDGGPDALYALRRGLSAVERLRPSEFLALMRRCGPDPRVVAECVRPLWPSLADTNASVRRDIREVVLAAWPNYYHLGEAHDVPFTLGLLLYEVRAYADAQLLFEASRQLSGDDAATLWNLGLCHVALGKPAEARKAFRHARATAPDLLPAGLALVKRR